MHNTDGPYTTNNRPVSIGACQELSASEVRTMNNTFVRTCKLQAGISYASAAISDSFSTCGMSKRGNIHQRFIFCAAYVFTDLQKYSLHVFTRGQVQQKCVT